jgi:hypothetical protein
MSKGFAGGPATPTAKRVASHPQMAKGATPKISNLSFLFFFEKKIIYIFNIFNSFLKN